MWVTNLHTSYIMLAREAKDKIPGWEQRVRRIRFGTSAVGSASGLGPEAGVRIPPFPTKVDALGHGMSACSSGERATDF